MDLPLLKELDDIQTKARADLAAASDEAALESWRVAYLGRRSRLNLILRGLASLPLDERRPVGGAANRLRQELEEALTQRLAALHEEAVTTTIETGRLDVTPRGRGDGGHATEDEVQAAAAAHIGDSQALQGGLVAGGGQIGAGLGLNVV